MVPRTQGMCPFGIAMIVRPHPYFISVKIQLIHIPNTVQNVPCKFFPSFLSAVFMMFMLLRFFRPPDHQEHVDARPHNREKFSSMDFAKEHNLVPIAANYFMMNMDIVEKKDKKPLHVE